MSAEILMLPPQVSHEHQVIAVDAHETEDGRLQVRLYPAGAKLKDVPANQQTSRTFPVAELPQVLAWIEEAAVAVAHAMQRAEKMHLRRQGYNV